MNIFFLPNLITKIGTKGVIEKLKRAYVLIIQPIIASFILCFSPIEGNKGEIKEYPIALNKFIKNNNKIFLFIFFFKKKLILKLNQLFIILKIFFFINFILNFNFKLHFIIKFFYI